MRTSAKIKSSISSKRVTIKKKVNSIAVSQLTTTK